MVSQISIPETDADESPEDINDFFLMCISLAEEFHSPHRDQMMSNVRSALSAYVLGPEFAEKTRDAEFVHNKEVNAMIFEVLNGAYNADKVKMLRKMASALKGITPTDIEESFAEWKQPE